MTDCVLAVKQLCVYTDTQPSYRRSAVGVIRSELPVRVLDIYTPCINNMSQAISEYFWCTVSVLWVNKNNVFVEQS